MKRSLYTVLIITFLYLCFVPWIAFAATNWYIDADAVGGTGCGAIGSPCTTYAELLSEQSVISEDSVYFDSADEWTFSSGPAFSVIAGVSYYGDSYGTGTRAALRMTAEGSTGEEVIRIAASNVRVQGFEVNMGDYSYSGISTYNASSDISYIVITNNVVHDSVIGGSMWNYGIHTGSTTANVDVTYVDITYNTVYNCGHEGITVYPSDGASNGRTVAHVNIQYNTVYETGQDGTPHPHCIYITNDSSDILVEHNTMYQGGGPNINIGVKNSSNPPNNITIRYNIIRNSDGAGLIIGSNDTTNLNTTALIYNNLIYNNGSYGIRITRGLSTSNIGIYNNTVYTPSGATARAFEVYDCTGTGTPIHLKNNIFVSANSLTVLKFNTTTDEALVDHANNLVSRGGTTSYFEINGTPYNQAQVKSVWDSSAQNEDPQFTSIGGADFTLQAGSPAIENGANLSAYLTTDYDSTMRTVPFDIGAYEYSSGSPGGGTTTMSGSGLTMSGSGTTMQ